MLWSPYTFVNSFYNLPRRKPLWWYIRLTAYLCLHGDADIFFFKMGRDSHFKEKWFRLVVLLGEMKGLGPYCPL